MEIQAPSVRVVFLWESMRRIGGVETFLRTCAGGLPRFGVDPYVLETESPSRAAEPVSAGGRIVPAFQEWWQTPLAYRRSVVRRIVSYRPHVLVTNSQWGWEYLTTFAGRVPIVDITHVDYPESEAWEHIAHRQHDVSRLVAVSDRIERKLLALPGCQGRIFNIPYGVTCEYAPRAAPTDAPPVILFVGRLTRRQKRVQDLVPFYERLSALLPDFSLTIVGDGPERSWLEQRLLDGSGRVTFTGALDPDAIREQHLRAHYLIQTSNFEGLSIALLEAMGRGVVPVVSAIDSGVAQAVEDGHTGFLFPIGAPDAAARCVAGSLGAWASLSRRAFEHAASRFSTDRMLAAYAALFRSVAGAPAAAVPRFVDDRYPNVRAAIARRLLPIAIYRGVLGRTP